MQTTIIKAGFANRQYWQDVWRYRELLYFLTWRDILVRYKQTTIGVLWAILRPLLTIIIFTAFAKAAKLTSANAPYPLFVMAGVLPWQLVSNALAESSNSLIGNANLISKVYFPRLLIPAGAVATSLVDFAISTCLMILLFWWYRAWPDVRVIFLPLFTALAVLAALGTGIGLAALNVKYRDFRHIVPFLVQFGLYVSPVAFSTSIIPSRWQPFYHLNPMVGIIDGFRWSLLRQQAQPSVGTILATVITSLCIFAGGCTYFRRTERTFADHI